MIVIACNNERIRIITTAKGHWKLRKHKVVNQCSDALCVLGAHKKLLWSKFLDICERADLLAKI